VPDRAGNGPYLPEKEAMNQASPNLGWRAAFFNGEPPKAASLKKEGNANGVVQDARPRNDEKQTPSFGTKKTSRTPSRQKEMFFGQGKEAGELS